MTTTRLLSLEPYQHQSTKLGRTELSLELDYGETGVASEFIVATKATPLSYGTMEDEGTSNSGEEKRFISDDLYDGKICVICFESQRNCFFTPCGHCITCTVCAKRLMEEERRTCPICRRLIHKARKLPSPMASFHHARYKRLSEELMPSLQTA
ncbi:RING/U-box superfamily protein isoform X2 [Wolffia australiana]